jgi:hypothetical protein
MVRRILCVVGVILLVGQLACGGGFVTELRLVLASSGPLISSLEATGVLPQNVGDTVVADFNDEALAVADFSTALSGCATDAVCKANAAEALFTRSEVIYNRGHFGSNPKILAAANVARGIFQSIRLYYASRTPTGKLKVVHRPSDADLKAKLDELRAALRP